MTCRVCTITKSQMPTSTLTKQEEREFLFVAGLCIGLHTDEECNEIGEGLCKVHEGMFEGVHQGMHLVQERREATVN